MLDELTPATRAYFLAAADDAGNWSGEPMTGPWSNFSNDAAAERGYLTALKKAGLITTYKDRGDTFIQFTDAGRAAALAAGHPVRG